MDILFIHIPKAAGTTVEEVFCNHLFSMSYRRGGKFGPLLPFDRENKCSPQHMHAELLEKHFHHRSFAQTFCVVRNPLERFISEFKFRCETHDIAKAGLNAFAEQVLAQYPDNPFLLDNHIRPQTEFIWRDCKVFKLEDGLDKMFAQLAATLGIALQPDSKRFMLSKKAAIEPLTAVNRARLIAFYQQDFETFGYALP
ncbi:sulfotransferase family 2 domain-containing protein [Cypionkella sinensis]|uniref:sulfotransferase family 2 domain-containing protein n=1 Tax=Cypionkella sinensis TaxID=1756043 RepID=UPI003643F6DD